MRLGYGWLMLALAAVSSSGHAFQDSASRPAPVSTTQQLFNDAESATLGGDFARALDLLTTLESRVARSARSLAIVRVRKAMVLVDLLRWSEARVLLDQALPQLPKDDPSLAGDRMTGAIALGRLSIADLDYDAALRHFAAAMTDAAQPRDRVTILLGQAQAELFIDPARALAQADEASGIVSSDKSYGKTVIAAVDLVRGRTLLNLGRFAEAEKVFAKAIAGQGGLTLTVNFNDLVTRSDASIAAMLAGHREAARNYLAYTGAGRMKKQDFTQGADMALPPCGIDGVQPDDFAIVEFGISDDGSISYARPVYGSRLGSLAPTFARAVLRWSWQPEAVKDIPLLFRFAMRLELRCSTAGGGPSVLAEANAALTQWLEGKGVAISDPSGINETARRDTARILADRLLRESPQSPELLMTLLPVVASPLSGREAVEHYGALLRQAADTANLPPLARLAVDIVLYCAASRTAIKIVPGSPFNLDAARYRSDPQALATFRIASYDAMPPREKKHALSDLDAVIDDADLAKDAPIRVAALVRRANARAAAKDMEGARRDFESTGLSAQQCSIVDARPGLRSSSSSSADYPTDMVSLGVEGWTQLQFDVSADGRTRNVRPVVTYPPMVFGKNGTQIITHARFEQSYRPNGEAGCVGSSGNVNFRMPG